MEMTVITNKKMMGLGGLIAAIIMGQVLFRGLHEHAIRGWPDPIDPAIGQVAIMTLLEQPPEQQEYKGLAIQQGPYVLQPMATYKIAARVLGRNDYWQWSDQNRLTPMDVALGWQKMADHDLLDKSGMTISQSFRFYYWHASNLDFISVAEASLESANVHLVPASPRVLGALERLHKNDLVYLQGKLINAYGKDFYWNTSLTREDTGNGACELLYVEKVNIF